MKFHWNTFVWLLLPIWAVAVVSWSVEPAIMWICVITFSLALIGTWVIQYQRKILETLERIEKQGIQETEPEEETPDLTE